MPTSDAYSYIILSGPTGAGKTRFGKWLSRKIEVPFLQRDTIMELLFEHFAPRSRRASERLRGISYELLFSFLNTVLQGHNPIVVESGFHYGEHERPFRRLQRLHGAHPIQIHLSADVETLAYRFRHRTIPRRHPGWHDRDLPLTEFREKIVRGLYDPLDIGGLLVRIDTTRGLKRKDQVRLLSFVKAHLRQRPLSSKQNSAILARTRK